ncbi:MAG: hypothetical protein AB1646_26205 [Thermodesulfobacteriota bacterium]
MVRRSMAIAVAMGLMLAALVAYAGNLSGRWNGSVMAHAVEIDVNQNGHQIDGVARLFSPFGKKTVYHFKGSVEGSRVQGAHHSGHRFQGNLLADGSVSGLLTTKHGHKLNVHVFRR